VIEYITIFDISKDVNEIQPENIDSTLVKRLDPKPLNLTEVNELQELKKLFIF
jgi:hypothetical protein